MPGTYVQQNLVLAKTHRLSRLVPAITASHAHQPNHDAVRSAIFVRAMISRQMARAHALRLFVALAAGVLRFGTLSVVGERSGSAIPLGVLVADVFIIMG